MSDDDVHRFDPDRLRIDTSEVWAVTPSGTVAMQASATLA